MVECSAVMMVVTKVAKKVEKMAEKKVGNSVDYLGLK